MWRQNVTRFKGTLDPLTVRRAVTALKRGLSSAGQLFHLSDALARHADSTTEVGLPGFDLFSGGDKRSPCAWLLPKLVSDEAALIYAYESIADRPMGAFRAPFEIPTQILVDAGNAPGKVLLGRSVRSSHWFVPMLRLVAYAQVLAEAPAHVRDGTYSIHVGNAYLEVSPRGVYSNFEKRFIPAAAPPADLQEALMTVPGVVTNHKTIAALYDLAQEADYSTMQALTACTHALHERMLTSSKLLHMLNHTVYRSGSFDPTPEPKRVVRYIARDPNMVAQAQHQALQALESKGPYVREEFFSAAVPGLYSAREFAARFGHPSSRKTGTVRDSTLVKWREMVKQRIKELADAVPP